MKEAKWPLTPVSLLLMSSPFWCRVGARLRQPPSVATESTRPECGRPLENLLHAKAFLRNPGLLRLSAQRTPLKWLSDRRWHPELLSWPFQTCPCSFASPFVLFRDFQASLLELLRMGSLRLPSEFSSSSNTILHKYESWNVLERVRASAFSF